MTQRSLPWTGTTTGDAGPYSDDNWQDAWARLFHAYAGIPAYANRGPLIDSGDSPDYALKVQATSPASAAVDVLPGSALVEGSYYESTAIETIAVAANASGNPRIDTIVLRKDDIAQTVRQAIKQGTPAATPAPPTLTQTPGTMWEIPIADIDVANGFTSITDTNITPRHEWANAADGIYLKDVNNHSGVTLETGDVVIWDSAEDRAVTLTTTIDHPLTAGVWVGRTQDGDYGRVLPYGIGLVRVNGSYSRGQGLVSSDTAGRALAVGSAGIARASLGILLEDTNGADTLALAFIDARRQTRTYAEYSYTLAQNTAGPTYTTGADRTVAFNTENADPAGIGSLASNIVTLAPGRYKFTFETTITKTGSGASYARFRVVDVTGGGSTTLDTSNNYSAVDNSQSSVCYSGYLTLTDTTDLEMRIRVVTTATTAQAALNLTGETEKYNRWLFERY